MSALDAFMTVWSRARQTFGEGSPIEGGEFDKSAQLQDLHDTVLTAAPRDHWTGGASESYADRNSQHASKLGRMAELDRQLGVEVDRSAAVVAAGRRDLDGVKQWVSDASAGLAQNAAGNRALWEIVSKGSGDVADIIRRSHNDMTAISGRIRGLGNEWDELSDKDKKKDGTDKKNPAGIQTIGNRFGLPADRPNNPPNITPPAGRWDGPPPAGEVPGTGYWAVDLTRPAAGPSPLPAPSPYRSPPPCVADSALEGPSSGVLTVGGDNPQGNEAAGFDLQNAYKFRISGSEFTGQTKMVQLDGKWYQAQWQGYRYEMNKVPILQGSGDLGGLTLPGFWKFDNWEPVSINQIGLESGKYPTGTLYIPDGNGHPISVVNGQFMTSTPVVPVMRRGN